MDVKEKLVPTISHSKEVITETALSIEAKVLRLPRSLQEETDGRLVEYSFFGFFFLVFSLYCTASRKAAIPGLKHRDLNSHGILASCIVLIVSNILLAVTIHEIWARVRFKKSTIEEIEDDLADLFGYPNGYNIPH